MEQIDAVLLDFSQAFDKVTYQILLEKLQYHGYLNNWIADSLADRHQEVVLEGAHRHILRAIGTVLGLLLFLVYIRDMPEGVRIFAEDSLVYTII